MLLTIFRRLFACCRRGSQTFLFCPVLFRGRNTFGNDKSSGFPFWESCENELRSFQSVICHSFSAVRGGTDIFFVLSDSSGANPHNVVRFWIPIISWGKISHFENVIFFSAICQTQVHLFYPKFKNCKNQKWIQEREER